MILNIRISNAINMVNLNRPDIAALDDSRQVPYRIGDIRELVYLLESMVAHVAGLDYCKDKQVRAEAEASAYRDLLAAALENNSGPEFNNIQRDKIVNKLTTEEEL